MSFEEFFNKIGPIGQFMLDSMVDLWNVMIANPLLASILSVGIIALIIGVIVYIKNIK